MSISFNESNGCFTINTKNTTYQMQVDEYGYLLHLYYGAKTEGYMNYLLTFADRGLSGNPYDAGNDRTYSLDTLPQEFPVQGVGDFRSPLLIVKDENGSFGIDLRFKEYEITDGKYSLEGLPAVYENGKADDAKTLKIVLVNERLSFKVTLLYGVLPHLDIITRSAIIENCGNNLFTVEKAQSACLDFVNGNYDIITFCGRHTMERIVERKPISHSSTLITSRRGTSSHQQNPFVIFADKTANETSGKCWGMMFVYSGGFQAEAELDQYNQTRIQIGLSEEKLSYPVYSGETLTLPEVILSFSENGFEKLSHNYHSVIQKHICRGKFRDAARPVLINSWESSYFDFTGESILELAVQAKSLGMDLLVMDDGWFANRFDDNRALGDWYVNEEKIGSSLKELVNKINGLGLSFGIWFEPEMVNEDSDLYRNHPDWALISPNGKPVRGRNQLVLDFSRKEVRDYIFNAICTILDSANIEYLKWDCNRSISDVYSHTADNQGRVLYDYVLGLYEVLEKLNERYPDLLIEGCSGGGGRFDAGMLYYTPQIWCSDNTDAIDRTKIQYGTSFAYPACTVSAHVSACPNHQTGRTTPIETRYAVASSGVLGYELNLSKLGEDEKEIIKKQISDYRRDREIVLNGEHYRLNSPYNDEQTAWQFVSSDKKLSIVSVVTTDIHGNMLTRYVKPRGLEKNTFYRIVETDKIYPSDALMDCGFPLPLEFGEYNSYVYHLERL